VGVGVSENEDLSDGVNERERMSVRVFGCHCVLLNLITTLSGVEVDEICCHVHSYVTCALI
jgi:hypothetical protein